MSIAAIFEQRLAARFPYSQWGEAGVLVGCSGGPDSTALLAALTALRPIDATGKLVAAHFNHRLRGADSDADEAQAAATATQLGLKYVVARGDASAAAALRGDGLEEAARDQRYRFLTDTAVRLGLRYIATAHTLDDQAETVLHRIVRGTGLTGLSGIPRARALADDTIGLVRPFLEFRRAEVLTYLTDRGLTYRIDASNDDVRFTRNRIRRELLPQLARDYNPQIVETLARLAAQADELREMLAGLVEPLVAGAVVRAAADGIEIDVSTLTGIARHLVREVLVAAWRTAGWPQQAMGFDEWNALATMTLDDGPSKRMLPGNVTAERRNRKLLLTR